MKTATIPPLRVTPELRAAAEAVLTEGETLSAFVELAVRGQIHRRTVQKEFIARGLAARDDAERTGIYHDADDVLREIDEIIDAAEAKAKAAK